MSIGGSPATPGNVPLNQNDVEVAKWKSSANATAQDVTRIVLDGTTVWTKPVFSISGSASWNRNNNKATINATVGANATKWTYQIGSGSQVTGSGTSVQVSDTSNGTKTVTLRSFKNSTQKASASTSYVVAVPSISHTLVGGDEEFTINITRSNHISSDKWQYKIGSGSWQTGGAIGTTSKKVTGATVGTLSVNVRLLNSSNTQLAISTAKNVVVEASTPEVNIPSNYTITLSRAVTHGGVVPYKAFPLNRGRELRWVVLYTVPLPKPAGFTAGSGSVSVEVDWNHVGNQNVYLYTGSGVAQTITMDNHDLTKPYVHTATSNISGVPSVFGPGTRFVPQKFGPGYYTEVANAKITYTHPHSMLWYTTAGSYSAGRMSHSANGKLVLIPFYDYDNDTPAMAYIGDGAYGKNQHSWAMHYYITANGANFAAPNACWLGQKITLHPGGDDPHWNHHQYGVTQRNPGGYAS